MFSLLTTSRLYRPLLWRRLATLLPGWNRVPAAWADNVYRAAVAAVVVGAAALAICWVFLVPIYQNPDEPANLDYALAINQHGGLFVLHDSSFQQLPSTVHPYTPYLASRVDLSRVAFQSQQRMPLDYGTPDFFAAIDRDAPDRSTIQITTPNRPFAVYPYGYYGALALWMELVHLWSDKPVSVFFGCRLFSVALFVCSILLLHATLRRMVTGRWFALALTAGAAFFPMTTFVAASVQTDNLSFTLVSAALYLAVRARQDGFRESTLALLGLTMGGLLVTKQHFFLCVALAIGAMLAVELPAARLSLGRWFRSLAWLTLPAFVTGGINLATTWGTVNYYYPEVPCQDWLTYTFTKFNEAWWDFYAGSTHITFVGVFGWLDAPLVIRNHRTMGLIRTVFGWFTWVLIALTLFRLEQVCSRLVRVARRDRWWPALRLAFSNPAINTYFLFTVFIFALYIRVDNRFGAQGRNWFPLWLPMLLIATIYAPKALKLRASRRLASGVILTALLLFSALGSVYGIRTIERRYYHHPTTQAAEAVLPLTEVSQ